jgi:hypothetical protein
MPKYSTSHSGGGAVTRCSPRDYVKKVDSPPVNKVPIAKKEKTPPLTKEQKERKERIFKQTAFIEYLKRTKIKATPAPTTTPTSTSTPAPPKQKKE